ncbi:MAG: SGNH/GDSL hydrolase family protein [Acidimicrobiales bacterium]
MTIALAACSSASTPRSNPAPAPPSGDDRAAFSSIPAGRGARWANDVQREDVAIPIQPDPFTGTRLGSYRSRYTNISHGERRTRTTRASGKPVVVWLLGGSAAFGEGQRDDHTIASDLVRMAEAEGVPLDVHNLGVLGWTLWQEQAAVTERLASGGPKPDLVIMYDGFNDGFYSAASVVTGSPDWDQPVVFSSSASPAKLTRSKVDAAFHAEGGLDEVARRIARRFRSLQALVASNVQAEHIAIEWFFQVDATASFEQFAAYSKTTPEGLTRDTRYTRTVLDEILDTMESGDLPVVHDLRDLVGSDDPPVFFDMVHTNEVGARMVARAIWDEIAPTLRDLHGS